MSIGKIRPQILNMPTEKKVEPFSVGFAYTGTVQEYVVPVTGLYKLEVWGANGGYNSGGGGYSIGYRKLNKGKKLYICCGGAGGTAPYESTGSKASGGYNGGGYGTSNMDVSGGTRQVSGGGGCTHIALQTGTLSAIGKTNFDNSGLIVAGGGGGGTEQRAGGSGGGISGGAGSNGGGGGTQTSGNSFGSGGSNNGGSGGGGGYYGGGSGGSWTGAGGGSGWIDGVPALTYKGTTYNPSTSNGVNSGTGKAKISYIG